MKALQRTLRVPIALVCAVVLSWPSSLLAQESTTSGSSTTAPLSGAAEHGVRSANMDPSVDPAHDFYRYAIGGWADQSEIPPDEAWWGVLDQTIDLTRNQLIEVLERYAVSDELPVGSDEWKAVQLFAQAKDIETRNAQGIAPIASDLERIDAIGSLDQLYAFLREAPLNSNVSCGLYCLYVAPDYTDSSVYAVWHASPYLGLPTRDYYWEDDEVNEPIREAYRAMMAKLLGFAGYEEAHAASTAESVYQFEKLLAAPMFRLEEWNDPQNYYNPRPVADLTDANSRFDWPEFLDALGLSDVDTVIVQEVRYLEEVDSIVESADLETIKDYLKLQVLRGTAESLSEEMERTSFHFYGTILNGVEEQRPLEERVIGYVDYGLGFALGRLYVEEYFPPEAKAAMEALVENEIAAARARIEALAWMAPETKEAAIAKLDTMNVKVAYPEAWRTYEDVSIEESLAETMLSAGIAEAKRWLARAGQQVDREEWLALPQEVNAYYNPSNNDITFCAAMLQPPYFDYEADLASNYGAIGVVIGHEITHAYDQGGSQFDANGNLADWWTEEDHAEFETLTAGLVAQYDTIEVLPGLFVDGDLTIGENIADLGGAQIAYDALQLALEESGDPGPIEGLTQDQRFFLAAAFAWAAEVRDEALRLMVEADFHSPDMVRGVQPARNMDAYYKVFGIEPGDPMYLPPDQRIVIW